MKKKQSDVEDFAISLFEEFGLPAAEAEEPADERSYDSACLARQESVRNLCRKVVKREKLMTEPVLREIFSALRRADKKGYRSGSCAEAELIRKAVGHYIRDRANEYIIELKKVEGQRIEDLSGKGREAYEELLFLLRGLYDDKLMLKPDEGTSHYRTDPWTSESCGTPILLRDFDPEKKGRYGENRIVLYPELKPGKRGSSWTNSYTMYDGYAAASHIAADLIKRTADQNARCGVTVYACIKEALIEKMKRRQPARIVFDKNLLVDRRAVIAFLRQNGLDVVDASDYPETQSLYPHCTSIPGDYLRILFGGEYTDISAALSERWDTDTEMLGKALRLFYEEYESDLLYEKYEKTTAHTYAEVYQDKKNIPETVQTAMKESPFHRYFGYVEYDQMVDREAVKEVYRDFEAVARTFFNDVNYHTQSSRLDVACDYPVVRTPCGSYLTP